MCNAFIPELFDAQATGIRVNGCKGSKILLGFFLNYSKIGFEFQTTELALLFSPLKYVEGSRW